MSTFDLVIRNGTIATEADTSEGDIGIRGGRIAALGKNLGRGAREIDAQGLFVLPGGVDSHVHVEQRGSPRVANTDTFASATLSAAFGGTTTIVTHARQDKGGSLAESVADYTDKAREAVIDYAFHLLVTDVTDKLLDADLPDAVAAGHTSIKIFMATANNAIGDADIIRLLARARPLGAQPVVHAENHAAIEWLTRQLNTSGRSGLAFNGLAKPAAVEREAIHRVLTYAEIVGVPLHVFHVTSGEAVEEIERARARGVSATGETCPQYFYFTESDLDRPLDEAAKLVFGPPPRTRADQDALWSAIRRGTIDVISSDHSPHPYSGPGGKREGANKGGFATTPHGIPGLETRMALTYSAGVASGRISLNDFVALTATNPAKRFGLYPRKGSILVGGDADLILWDAKAKSKIRNADLHHRVEYTPYEGLEVSGAPVTTISRGDVIVAERKATCEPRRGQLLVRTPMPIASGRFPGGAG